MAGTMTKEDEVATLYLIAQTIRDISPSTNVVVGASEGETADQCVSVDDWLEITFCDGDPEWHRTGGIRPRWVVSEIVTTPETDAEMPYTEDHEISDHFDWRDAIVSALAAAYAEEVRQQMGLMLRAPQDDEGGE